MSLKKRPNPWLLTVYDVFRPYAKEDRLFCIVAEKLGEAKGSELVPYSHLFQLLRDRNLPFRKTLSTLGLTPELVQQVRDYYTAKDRQVQEEGVDLTGWGNLAKNFKYVPIMERFGTEIDTLDHWAKALKQHKINFTDLKIDNMKFRGRRPILVDLGYSTVPEVSIPLI